MVWLVTYASSVYGSGEVFKYYGLPWFLVSHWFVMITYVSCSSLSILFGFRALVAGAF